MPYRNPYESGTAFPDMSPTINSFVDNLVRLKTHQEDIDMRGRQLQQGEEQFNKMFPIQQGQLDVQRGNLDVSRGNLAVQQEEAAKKPPLPDYQQILNPSEVVTQKISMKTALGEGALKVLAPVFNTIDEVAAANPKTTKWDAYTAAKGAWAGQRDEVIENSVKYMMSPEFEKLKPAQKEGFTQLYNAIKYDTTGEIVYDKGIFKNTVASKRMEEENAKAALLEQKYGFQNELLNQKFDQWKEVQGIKLQSAKELQDAKYAFLKDLKIAGVGADALGRKILQGEYMEQLRDVDKEIRAITPLTAGGTDDSPEGIEAAVQAAKAPLIARRENILSDLRELSGIPQTKPAATDVMKTMPPAAQNKGRTIRDTATGKRYRSNGTSWIEVK